MFTKPIESQYVAQMNAIARVLDETFNGTNAVQGQRETGFVLLVFPFGEKEGRCNYISNGADRSQMVKLLREQANRFDLDAH